MSVCVLSSIPEGVLLHTHRILFSSVIGTSSAIRIHWSIFNNTFTEADFITDHDLKKKKKKD